MRILVTGGCGFIGSHFIRRILKNYPDYRIVNLDKLTYAGNLDNLKDVENNINYSFVHGDICDQILVDSIVKNVDWIVNFAAESHVDRSIKNAALFIKTDIFGIYVLLEAAKKYKTKKFLHISTDEVYGSTLNDPFVEGDPLEPNNPYSASKAGAEMLARSYMVTHKVPIVITRSSNNYGPYQHPEKLVPRFVSRLLKGHKVPLHGDGSAIRDWLHVTDNCSAIDFVLHNGEIGEVYNVGGDNERKNIEITKIILKDCDKDDTWIESVPDRKGQDARYSLSCEKLHNLGWKPIVPFEVGIKDTIQWYKNNKNWWDKINKIVIAGARSTGHSGVVMNTLKLSSDYDVKAFIDRDLMGRTIDGIKVIGSTNDLPDLSDFEGAFVAIGKNDARKEISIKLKSAGLKLINIIHPTSILPTDLSLGDGNFIGAGAVLGGGVTIGNNVIIGMGSTIGNDVVIEDNVHIGPGVNIDARTIIMQGTMVGLGSKIITDLIIGENVLVKPGSVVVENVSSVANSNLGENDVYSIN